VARIVDAYDMRSGHQAIEDDTDTPAPPKRARAARP